MTTRGAIAKSMRAKAERRAVQLTKAAQRLPKGEVQQRLKQQAAELRRAAYGTRKFNKGKATHFKDTTIDRNIAKLNAMLDDTVSYRGGRKSSFDMKAATKIMNDAASNDQARNMAVDNIVSHYQAKYFYKEAYKQGLVSNAGDRLHINEQIVSNYKTQQKQRIEAEAQKMGFNSDKMRNAYVDSEKRKIDRMNFFDVVNEITSKLTVDDKELLEMFDEWTKLNNKKARGQELTPFESTKLRNLEKQLSAQIERLSRLVSPSALANVRAELPENPKSVTEV